jgi:methyl-accepting chemotaxis protein
VHQLQRERGLSAVYMKSKDASDASKLSTQRGVTDVALETFMTTFTNTDAALLHPKVGKAAVEVGHELDDVAAVRSNISSGAMLPADMKKYYSGIISHAIHILEIATHVTKDAATVERLVAIDVLAQGKERAGLERAVGATGFASGRFDRASYVAFVTAIAQQELAFKEFRAFGEPELVTVLDAVLASEMNSRVEEYRALAIGSQFGGTLANLDTADWFEVSSERIQGLREVEEASNNELVDYVHKGTAAASLAVTSSLVLNGVILLATLIIAFVVMRSITLPLARMTTTMGELAEGRFDIEVLGVKHTDELGEMARAVSIFRENGIKVANLSAEEEERLAEVARARAEMMQTLQRAFGVVVDAAVDGDFSQRVTSEFPDAELNELAAGVNKLVETVERGIHESGEVLSALAKTDLTMRVEGEFSGAFDQLKSDTNAVADKLSDVIGQLRDTSRGVKTATGEILAGANDLSERTTKQAATIEETSAAMEQLSSTVVNNAKQAEEASVNSRNVSQTAEAGGHVMEEANAAMGRITSSSSKISNIIGMIDDIAFQTNLLALNASVEAARAGEAGKGFAVVAVEVRRLAQSAAEASNEVKQLVEQSASEVDQGSKLVGEASDKLRTILEKVSENGGLINSIAAASRDQASAIEEVNTAVRQMDEMTQHNAALVEQTNAAIEQTESQANELDRIVEVFRLTDSDQQSAAAPAAPTITPKAQPAARAYLSQGGAAIDSDWSEF